MTRVAWAVGALLAAIVVAWRFEFVVDLDWFLPTAGNDQQQILLDRLGQGPGSQLVFAVYKFSEDANPREVSKAVASNLRDTGLFSRVVNGLAQNGGAVLPEVVWRNRYLLVDQDFSLTALQQTFAERRADLAWALSPELTEMIAADPQLAAISVLESAAPVSAQEFQWLDKSRNEFVLIAETTGAAFDLGAQTTAVAALGDVALLNIDEVQLYGIGVYSVDLQDTIRREATLRSVGATLAVAIILVVAYRRFSVLFAGLLPLALGGLAGLAAIALAFGKVHGITLAFGFTMLGIALDYPLHYLSHTRSGSATEMASVWRTMLISVVSTLIAFAALALAGSRGLAQMGLFASTAIFTAWLATRTLLPGLMPPAHPDADQSADKHSSALDPGLRQAPWCVIAGIAIALLVSVAPPVWHNDLSVVSPVPKERILADQQMRQRIGAPDLRSLLVVRDQDLQRVLETTEDVGDSLRALQANGQIDDFQLVTNLIPSAKTQQRRIAQLSTAKNYAAQVEAAALAAGFRADAFTPYLDALATTAEGQHTVSAQDYSGTELQSLVDNLLYRTADTWIATIALFGEQDLAAAGSAVATQHQGVVFVDLKEASNSLMARYADLVSRSLLVAAVLVAFMLLFTLRAVGRTIWLLGTLGAALLATAAITMLVLGGISIFNLMAGVLVAGLGLDYALFFSRSEPDAAAGANTYHAVSICALSTFAAFTILAFSTIPVLQSMGVTVAAGVASSFLLARIGRAAVSA